MMTALTPALRVVQPPPVRSLHVPYLAVRRNKTAAPRWYFQPKTEDRAKGWAVLRLHDKHDRPIVDGAEAAAACAAIAKVYTAWRRGEPGNEPARIDDKGRVLDKPARRQRKSQAMRWVNGSIGAIVEDFKASEEFKGLKPGTQADYELCLDALVEKFGTRQWRTISRREAKAVIMQKHASEPSQAHQWYRTWRACLNKTQLIYDEADHPGYVPEAMNPFADLDIGMPKAKLIVWPAAAVEAAVTLADRTGRPSLGDAIVMMYWLGTRRQDWMRWPPTIFDTPYLSWATLKTDEDVTIPWSKVPALKARIEAAKERMAASAVRATTFFNDDVGHLPWSEKRFFTAFDDLRTELAKEHPSFPTRYAVRLIEAKPMELPTSELTMRTLRHTCITVLHDAGATREQIRAITGHKLTTIDQVLDRYTKLTVDQADAALSKRLDWEANKGGRG